VPRLQASFSLAPGTSCLLANGSSLMRRLQDPAPLPTGSTLTVQPSGVFELNGTELPAATRLERITEAQLRLHTPQGLAGPTALTSACSADFSTAQYTQDPYSYAFGSMSAYVSGLPASGFEDPGLPAALAAVAYGFRGAAASGYNASLLVQWLDVAQEDDSAKSAPPGCRSASAVLPPP
jgi:hypothetical protein